MELLTKILTKCHLQGGKEVRWYAVPVLGLLVATTACSGGAEPLPEISESSQRELLGVLATRDPEHDNDIDIYEALVEDARASCMRSEGFEYLAYLPDQSSEAIEYATLPDDEFREQYGFGMLTLFEETASPSVPTAENPNEIYKASLSEVEREAFDDSYGGCSEQARIVVGDPPGLLAISEETSALLEDASTRAKSTKAYIEADDSWSPCMREEGGHDFDSRDAMFELLSINTERFAAPFLEALNAAYGASDSDAAQQLSMVDVLSPIELGEYQAAMELEIDIAVADGVCGAPIDIAYDEAYFAELDRLAGI